MGMCTVDLYAENTRLREIVLEQRGKIKRLLKRKHKKTRR